MTIYEEALMEAKKLKEIAEIEARNAILEAIAPEIKKMIGKEVAGLSSPLFEEDDKLGALPSDLPVDGSTPGDAATPVSMPSVVSGVDDAPIKASGEEMMNMPLPGPDGKLVVDFEDLFTPSDDTQDTEEEETPASAETMPNAGVDGELGGAPPVVPSSASGEAIPPETVPLPEVPPTPENEPMEAIQITGEEEDMSELSYETFKESLDGLSLRIDKAFWKPSVPTLVKEALQEKLFEAYEKLEKLSESGKVSLRLVKLNENRLEFLHMKLKEASVGTNYQRTEKGNKDMKSLKKFASKLFEDTLEAGEVTSPADSHEDKGTLKVDNAPQEKAADKAGAHAMKVTEPTVTLKTEAKDDDDESKIYEAELKKLEEELKEVLAAEEGEQDLAGAASSIPDKKVGPVDTTKSTADGPGEPAAKVQGVKKESAKNEDDDLDEWIEHDKSSGSEKDVGPVSEKKKDEKEDEILEVKDDELAEAVRSIKKENIKRRIRALKEALAECEMEDEMTMPSMPKMEDEALGGGVPGPMGGAKPPMAEEDTVVNFNFDLDDLGMGDMGDEDEIEIVDDEPEGEVGVGAEMEPPTSDLDMGGEEEEGEMVGGEEEEEFETALPPPGMHMEGRNKKMSRKQVRPLTESKKVAALRAQLSESQLWNAKVVYLNKFLYKEDLSRQQKQKIAEYLDKAKTLQEAKTIYGRVKKLLETASSKRKVAGSSSRVTTKGGATNSLQESVAGDEAKNNLFEGASLVEPERNRLMELAGIKKRS